MNSTSKILKAAFRQVVNAVGYDIVRYDNKNARTRLARLLVRHNINLILDVGANCGDFGSYMRELGYRGRIISFEPTHDAFRKLEIATRNDHAWQAVNIGLGDSNEERPIHVAANSHSSSFLPMLEAHIMGAPDSRYERDELVTIRRLGDILKDFNPSDEAIFLKVDTQGFEKNVIDGARDVLDAVPLIQLECAYVPLYEGAELVECIIGHMRALGYDPVDSFPVFYHQESGHLMQPDILFLRR